MPTKWCQLQDSGRIQTLLVDEGQDVKLAAIAVIESDDLEAARKAADATAGQSEVEADRDGETERQTRGETGSATVNAEAMVKAAGRAGPGPATTNTSSRYQPHRSLAQQGIMSAQAKDEAVTSLQATRAAVDSARKRQCRRGVAAPGAAHELLTVVAARTVDSTAMRWPTQGACRPGQVQVGYSQVFARSAQGERACRRQEKWLRRRPLSPSWI